MKVITIGRDISNDVVIDDGYASRHHMQIVQCDDGSYKLADFGSSNGTFVNGQRVKGEIVLEPNDIVRIGNTTVPWRMYFETELPQKEDAPQEDEDSQPQQDCTRQTQELPNKTNWKIWVWIIAGVIVSAAVVVYLLFFNNSDDQTIKGPKYSDVQSVFVSGNDIYAAGSTCAGASLPDVPTLWINGQPQSIGNEGRYNMGKSVFVSGSDVYVAVTEKENNRALLWKNGERQILAEGTGGSEANCVYVSGNDVYVAGQKDGQLTLWENGVPHSFGLSGSAESVVVKGDNVYVAGYVGDPVSSEAFMYLISENREGSFVMNMDKVNSIFITDNGDVYAAGVANNTAALWKNGELIDLDYIGKGSAESVAVNRVGNFVVTGISQNPNSRAAVWVNGESVKVDDVFGYQAMSVATDGSSFYLGGCGKDGVWSVWKYDGMYEFDVNRLERVKVDE